MRKIILIAALSFSFFTIGHSQPHTVWKTRSNRVDEGVSYLLQATKHNPGYSSAFFNLGAVCYDNSQYQNSIKYYQKAEPLRPGDDRIPYGIAAAQYALQQYDKSLENCKKALALNKNNENAKALLQMLSSRSR